MCVRLGESPNQLSNKTGAQKTDQIVRSADRETDAQKKWRKRKWLVSQVLTYLEKNELRSV